MATISSARPDVLPSRRRLAGGTLLAIGLTALALGVTVERVTGAPAMSLSPSWSGAAANAAEANRLAQPGASSAALIRAERAGRAALVREPVNVPAVRALALVAALRNDLRRADRLFRYAEQLSRRDLTTELWLIEERVRHQDVVGALTHYDRALRTVQRARSVLFPVLIPAMATPDVARAAARILAQRVAWGPDFIGVMAQAEDGSPEALGRLLLAARLRPAIPGENGALALALGRLVSAGRFDVALAAYRQATGQGGAATPVRDGGFEGQPVLPPFDWSLTDETDLAATREAHGGGTALVLRAANGRSGDLARQLVMLSPGRYRLQLTASGAGADPVARAAVTMTCADRGGELLRLSISAVQRARQEAPFVVPAGCRAQWLVIAAPAGLGDADGGVAIDDLAIVPAPAHAR